MDDVCFLVLIAWGYLRAFVQSVISGHVPVNQQGELQGAYKSYEPYHYYWPIGL